MYTIPTKKQLPCGMGKHYGFNPWFGSKCLQSLKQKVHEWSVACEKKIRKPVGTRQSQPAPSRPRPNPSGFSSIRS